MSEASSTRGRRVAIGSYTGEQLLRVGFVLEDLANLDVIAALLTDDQVDELLAAAVGFSLWDEVGHLVERISDLPATRLAARFAALPADVQDDVRAAADSGELERAASTRLGAG